MFAVSLLNPLVVAKTDEKKKLSSHGQTSHASCDIPMPLLKIIHWLEDKLVQMPKNISQLQLNHTEAHIIYAASHSEIHSCILLSCNADGSY